MPPEMEGGVWANFAGVSHTEYEFTIDFARMNFGDLRPDNTLRGVIVQRINLSPRLMEQLIAALEENMNNYTAKISAQLHPDQIEDNDEQA